MLLTSLLARAFVGACLASLTFVSAFRLLQTTTLGEDPDTVNRLNGNSFQQEALLTFDGWQYATFYPAPAGNASAVPRHVAVARRELPSGSWEVAILEDYAQTGDDGHDVISIGIALSDGSVHLSFDMHDVQLNYRLSRPGVAFNPRQTNWSAALFGPVINYLPGMDEDSFVSYFTNVTYPRFLSTHAGGFLMEFRNGQSGLGNDWLFSYDGSSGNWSTVGQYLEGVNNNAYINGLDQGPDGSLHASWTYRDYIPVTAVETEQQAGPNGPENNHDVVYAYSPDLGQTWRNTWGQVVATLSNNESVLPTSAGVTVFSVPKYGGILNQEAQCVDPEGRIHVLNRENGTGVEMWYHYWRSTTHEWTRTPLPPSLVPSPTVTGNRGKLASSPTSSNLYAILPANEVNVTAALTIIASTPAGHFRDWSVVWSGGAFDTEPLYDRYRLESDGVLSLFLRTAGSTREIVIYDFQVD